MSWRNPRYAFLHAGRDAGASAITGNNAWATDNPKDFLIDDRAGALATFATSQSNHWIEIDRGAGSLEAIDRMIIPSGHNLDGTTLTVNTGASSPPGTSRFSDSVAAGLIDEAITSNSDRYVRLVITGTGTWAIPELIFTRTRTTTRGPEQGWGDYYRHNTLDFELSSGAIASLSLGADRRFFDFLYRNVKDSGDLTVFSDLITEVGTSKPFYLDPPFDTETAIWVKLTEDSRQVQDPQVPAATDATQRRIALAMLEHLA